MAAACNNKETYYTSLNDALQALQEHEIQSGTKYIRINGNFQRLSMPTGKTDLKRKVLYFQDGLPLMKGGSTSFHCQHGPDKNKSSKVKKKQLKNADGDYPVQKSRKCNENTYKLDCPAKVTLSQQLIFDYYQKDVSRRNMRRYRQVVTANVKKVLEDDNKDTLQFRARYVLVTPGLREHVGHPVGKSRTKLNATGSPTDTTTVTMGLRTHQGSILQREEIKQLVEKANQLGAESKLLLVSVNAKGQLLLSGSPSIKRRLIGNTEFCHKLQKAFALPAVASESQPSPQSLSNITEKNMQDTNDVTVFRKMVFNL